MSLLPLALLLVAAGPRLVLDDTIELPRAEWRYVDIAAAEPKAVINCEYLVVSENTPVRVVWLARADLEAFRAGRVRTIAATSFGLDGKLRHFAPTAGDYAIVVESEPGSRSRAKVKLKVWLESAVSPKYVSPQRRLAVIAISSVVFFSIVSISAFKLRRGIGA
jgi:hypothetical protein